MRDWLGLSGRPTLVVGGREQREARTRRRMT
jgi:hypothetical protein